MRRLNLTEKAKLISYSLLTSQIEITLEDVIQGKELQDREKAILYKGAEILLRATEGATLVEGREFKRELAPTVEGLSIYGYALSALPEINQIQLGDKPDNYTAFFDKLHGEMVTLINEDKRSVEELKLMKGFFQALGSTFRSYMQKESFRSEKPHAAPWTYRPNESSYA